MEKDIHRKERLVWVEKNDHFTYPDAPFNPGTKFAELGQLKFDATADVKNPVYGYVRNVLIGLDLDKENQGTAFWKPFKDLIKPGQHAVLKPNYVKGNHPLGEIGVLSMITHASIMRPVIDYLLISTGGDVKITIVDVPLQSSVWSEIIEGSGTDKLLEFYESKGIKINLVDARREISNLNEEEVIDKREFKDRDPLGYAYVDLKDQSALMPVIKHFKRFMITDYDKGTVSRHHNATKNQYCIAKTVLAADLFINLPKLKTHRKAGLTCASKNLIGMNGDKRWIAHHREGTPKSGGDECPRIDLRPWIEWRLFAFLKRHPPVGVWLATKIRKYHTLIFAKKRKLRAWIFENFKGFVKLAKAIRGVFKKKEVSSRVSGDPSGAMEISPAGWPTITFEMFRGRFPEGSREAFHHLNPARPKPMEGSWYGNDTIWRTICDLNHIILFADKEGDIKTEQQRGYFCIVDGILGGEREGPMEHTPKNSGTLVGGFHPTSIDYTCAWIMGLDWRKIPAIREILKSEVVNFAELSEESIKMAGNEEVERINMKFYPTIGWRDHIERI